MSAMQQGLFRNYEPQNANARNSTLWELMSRYRKGLLQKPPHQRDVVWSGKKIDEWDQTLLTDTVLGTSFVTYQIRYDDGSYGPVYLNDGHNRVALANRFYENCAKYNMTQEQAESRLSAIEICVVHMHHDSVDAAVRKFVQLNQGTGLTPLEMNKYHIAYLSEYSQDLLDQVVMCIAEAEKYLTGKESASRDKRHKMNRDAYALFLRFLDSKMSRMDYDITSRQRKVKAVEDILREQVNELGHELDKHVRQFIQFVENERAIIKQAWDKYVSENSGNISDVGLSQTTFRFCLHVGIWRRHRGLKIEMHMAWLSALFAASGGRSSVLGEKDHKTIPTGRLSYAWGISKLIGQGEYADMLRGDKGVRRKRTVPQPPGIHNSHVMPFKTHGNGPTVPEPALLNLARGARPMEAA